MSDEEKKEQEQNLDKTEEKKDESVQSSAETKKTEDEHMIPKSRFDEVNQRAQDAEKRIKALEKTIDDSQKARLKEQEDYKALYEKAEGELSELKPKAEKSETLEAVLKETLDAELANIPADRRGLIPEELSVEGQLRYISKNRSLLSKSAPVDQGAGERGGGQGTSVELTAQELQIAKDYGMKPEEYAKYKDKETTT